MSLRLLRACAVKMLMEPSAMGGTSTSYSLEFTQENAAAVIFNAECAGELSDVAFTKDGERSTLPFAPAAALMDTVTLQNQYKDKSSYKKDVYSRLNYSDYYIMMNCYFPQQFLY